MEDWITIRNIKKRNPNMGTRAIAKQLDLSRNTVKNALRSNNPPAYKRKEYTNPELKPFQEYIIEQYFIKKLKGSRVLNDLRSKGCKVSSSAFYRYIQQYKTVFTRAYMRYETKPGEQGQFDWSPYTVIIEDKPIKIQVFCFILGCSRYRTYMHSLSQSRSSVFEALEEGLSRIGGVPDRIQTDNHATLYNAKKKEWNPEYLQFASHYGFKPSRSEVRHPWSKGKVENPFSYLETHFIADNKFESFEDFSLKLLDFEKQVNQRIHTTTKKTPIELFNPSEIAVLSSLPNNRFIGISEEFRKVSSDCLISVDGNRYSVPHIFAGRDVWIRISQGRYLEVYSQSNKLMAKHTLERTEKGKIFMSKEHFQGYRGTKGTWNFLSQQFLTIVPGQDDFLKNLKAQKRINPSRHLTIIVEAAKHFSKKDIKNVIKLCDQYNVYRGDLFVDLLHQNSEPVFIPKLDQVNDLSILSPPGVIRSLDSYRTENFVERSGDDMNG
ncbi:MAG: IS21 family transposase [Methanosarcinaceae archaeon]